MKAMGAGGAGRKENWLDMSFLLANIGYKKNSEALSFGVYFYAGGEGEIRTLGTSFASTHDFQSCSFGRARTPLRVANVLLSKAGHTCKKKV